MKRALPFIAILLLVLPAFAQSIKKPTKDATPPTTEQEDTIREGIAFHDDKQYDEAIKRYKSVLEENPHCVVAMYELALSYYDKKDLDNGLAYALKASDYRSDLLPRVYMMIANIVDDMGEPEKALQIYEQAIKQRPDLSILRFNYAITNFRLGNKKEGRTQVKKAVELDYAYSSPHYLLAVHFSDSGYKIPAVLAALRFLSLEGNTDRAQSIARTVAQTLDSGATRNKETGNINIFINTDTPKDEGDFTTAEMMLSMTSALRLGGEKEDKDKSREEKFVDALDMLLSNIGEDKENRKTFCGKNYFPYLKDLKAKGYSKVLGYLVLAQIGSGDALDWLGKNEQHLRSFTEWAAAYKLD